MKNLLPAIFLSLIGSVALLPAQEAWILEMPHKYSDYLIKKAIEEEYDTVSGIIEKFPNLIASKQIREIDLIKWKAEAPLRAARIDVERQRAQGTFVERHEIANATDDALLEEARALAAALRGDGTGAPH